MPKHTQPWSVMLVDHDRLFSAALSAVLARGPFQVQCIASDLEEAARTMEYGSNADLIILAPSLTIEPDHLILGMQTLCDLGPVRLAVLCLRPDDEMITTTWRGGGRACLGKSISADSLLHALELVMLGQLVYPPQIARLLSVDQPEIIGGDGIDATAEPRNENLSKREMQILRCLLAGQSNKLIARQLDITESTVKMHFKNVMRKINAQNRTQAAVWAIQHGVGTSPAN